MNIGNDCWSIINDYKNDLEFNEHKKSMKSTLIIIKDDFNYLNSTLKNSPVAIKVCDLYLNTITIENCMFCNLVHYSTPFENMIVDMETIYPHNLLDNLIILEDDFYASEIIRIELEMNLDEMNQED